MPKNDGRSNENYCGGLAIARANKLLLLTYTVLTIQYHRNTKQQQLTAKESDKTYP